DVSRILDREPEVGRKEEQVERERRENRGQYSGPALPDPGTEEDGEHEEERDGRGGETRDRLEDRRRGSHDEHGRRVARPPRGAKVPHAPILWARPGSPAHGRKLRRQRDFSPVSPGGFP